MTFPFGSPFRIDVPEKIRAWAEEWAHINCDLAVESLIVSGNHRLPGGPPVLVYGGSTPIENHIDLVKDEIDEDNPAFPIWGVVLACPEGRLEWEGGSVPIGPGSVYTVDPTRLHGVSGPRGAIAFAATFSYDPRTKFENIAAFAEYVMTVVADMHRKQPDPIRFIEIETGMEPGELG